MADRTTILPTLIDTSRHRLSTVALLADIPEEAAMFYRNESPT